MSSQSMLLQHPSTLNGGCPACHHYGTFTLIGVQKWPLKVAAHTNLPPQMGLYACPNCDTTVSETVLLNEQSA
jgi:hypothetical protein